MNHLTSISVIAFLMVALWLGLGQSAKQVQSASAQAQSSASAPASASAQPAKTGSQNDPPRPAAVASGPSGVRAYAPTAEQAKDLTIDSLDAQLAQKSYAEKAQTLPEFAQFQQKVNKLQADCLRVIAENKWPKQVQCDLSKMPVEFCEKLPCQAGAGAVTGSGAVTQQK